MPCDAVLGPIGRLVYHIRHCRDFRLGTKESRPRFLNSLRRTGHYLLSFGDLFKFMTEGRRGELARKAYPDLWPIAEALHDCDGDFARNAGTARSERAASLPPSLAGRRISGKRGKRVNCEFSLGAVFRAVATARVGLMKAARGLECMVARRE